MKNEFANLLKLLLLFGGFFLLLAGYCSGVPGAILTLSFIIWQSWEESK